MHESRCGICCNSCEGREESNCKGCLNMKLPFWGQECEVKSCCENKGLNHCGECNNFPCNTLETVGAEQGYDPGPKLEQCRIWAEDGKHL